MTKLDRNGNIDEFDESVSYYHDFDEKNGMADEVDPRGFQLTITHEGIIMDAYDNSTEALIGTKAMMWDEWWEEIAGR